MIREFGSNAQAQAAAVAARLAKLGHAEDEATWKAIAKAIEKSEWAEWSEGRNPAIAPDPDSGDSACPKCGAPRTQLALDCREFFSGAVGFITCTCRKCGHTSGGY